MGGSIMGNAGRVLMIPKGDYNAATTYEMLDCVYYNGRSYVCKQTSTGNAPTNTTYWQVMTPDSSAEIQALTNQVNGNWSEGGKNLWANDNVSGTAFVKVTLAKALPAGTYTISAVVTSSDTDKTVCRIADGDGTNTLALIGRSSGGARVSATFTIGSALSEISFYASETYYFSTGDTFSFTDIQIEEGSTATTYQPYAKTNVELTQALSASTVIDNVIDTTSASGVSGVSASLEKLTDINMGILFISFTTTADAGGSGLILGMLKSSCTPAHSTCRAVVPLVNDSGGDVEGSLYLNSTSVVRVYKVTSGHKYYATIPIILA